MGDSRKHLVFGILKFLDEQSHSNLSEDAKEGLEGELNFRCVDKFFLW